MFVQPARGMPQQQILACLWCPCACSVCVYRSKRVTPETSLHSHLFLHGFGTCCWRWPDSVYVFSWKTRCCKQLSHAYHEPSAANSFTAPPVPAKRAGSSQGPGEMLRDCWWCAVLDSRPHIDMQAGS
eukprot:s518_g22.t1